VSLYQKGKTNRDFTEGRDSEWQWHQLGHMQLLTDNHTSTPPLSFFAGRMPFLPPNQQRQGTEGISVIFSTNNGSVVFLQYLVSGINSRLLFGNLAPSSSALTLLVGSQEEHPACRN